MAIYKLVEKDGRTVTVFDKENPDYDLPTRGWRIRVHMGYVPDGDGGTKRKTITKTFDRKKDADKEVRRLERQKDTGTLVQPSRETLTAYLGRWLDEVKEGRVRQRTLHEYRGMVRRYIAEPPDGTPPIGAIKLHRLTPDAFEALYAFLWKERGLSPRTLRYLHSIVRQALGHAVKTGQLGRNPTDHVSPPTKRHDGEGGQSPAATTTTKRGAANAMSADEARRFQEAARDDRYHALWLLLITGGLRPGEALALAWDDVDFDQGRVHVQRGLTRVGVDGWKLVPPKTDKSRRAVALPDVTMDALQEWATVQKRYRLKAGGDWKDHGFVFTTLTGAPLDDANLRKRNFTDVMARAGLGVQEVREGGRWVAVDEAKNPKVAYRRRFKPAFRIYDLRHTCATLLLKRGINPKIVQERLGHSTIMLTLDTYSHVLPHMQEGAADELQAVFGER